MNSNKKRDNSLMFNLITLLTFGLTLFLIIFLKRTKGKKVEHSQEEEKLAQGRVKIPLQKKEGEKRIPKKERVNRKPKNLNQRQANILKHMREKGRMEPREIYKLVPNVSTRTVRRDMDKLVEEGLVLQRGTTKSTQYIFKG